MGSVKVSLLENQTLAVSSVKAIPIRSWVVSSVAIS
jgi:hypothetical protein